MSIHPNPSVTLKSLVKALADGELFYFYQPIVSLEKGEICGAEALLRWKTLDGLLIEPASFITLAEETGFIVEMTRELLPALVNDIKRIQAIMPSLYIHLNLSSADLASDDLTSLLEKNMRSQGFQVGLFRVEIVERVFMPPISQVQETIHALASMGIQVVLNDFSAGFTTLKFLSQLPLAAIKLALNIIQRATLSHKDFRVLRHLVSMAHQLGLDVIAEGIETEEMYDLTLSTGATAAQGYYFSHPLPLEEYLALLKQGPHWSNYPFGMEYLTQIDLVDFRRDVIRAALAIKKYADEEARQRAIARLPELDYQKNKLGKWYSAVGHEWENVPGFNQLWNTHKKMFETGNALIHAALSNEPEDKIETLIDLLSEQSGQVAQFLHYAELCGLKNHYRS